MTDFTGKYGTADSERLAYFKLGRTLNDARKYSAALSAFETALDCPGDAPAAWELYYHIGLSNEYINDKKEAADAYLQAIGQQDTDHLFVLLNLYDILNDKDTAQVVLEKSSTWDPGEEIKYNNTAAEGVKIFKRIVLAKAGLAAQQPEKARAVENLDHISFPESPYEKQLLARYSYTLALTEVSKKEYLRAKELFTKAISGTAQTEKIYPFLYLDFINCLLKAGLPNDAATALADFSKENLNDAANEEMFTRIVQYYLVLHAYDDAVHKLQAAIQKFPFSEELLFLKIQVYIESQYDIREGARVFSELYYNESKKDSTRKRLEKILSERKDDDNARYFAAFIQCLTGQECSLDTAGTDKLKLQAVSSMDGYTATGNLLLAALLYEKNSDQKQEAIQSYFSAGLNYYWLGKYPNAIYYIGKARQLAGIEKISEYYSVWFYLADTIRINSYTTTPPYIESDGILQALKIIDETNCRTEQVVQKPDENWFYLVAGRAHADKYSFATENILTEYWQAIVYTERALIHSGSNYVAWVDLAKYYRSVRLFRVSYECILKAQEINNNDPYVLENLAMLQLALQKTGEARDTISALKKSGLENNYLHWEGYIDFLEGHYDDAIARIDRFTGQFGEDPWALFIRLLCLLFGENTLSFELVSENATRIRMLDKLKYPHFEMEFSLAEVFSGSLAEAIALLEESCGKTGLTGFESHGLSLYYLLAGYPEKAQEQFDKYISTEYSITDLKIYEKEIGTFERVYSKEHRVVKLLEPRKELVKSKITALEKNPHTADSEFEKFMENLEKDPGKNPLRELVSLAYTLRLARNCRKNRDGKEAALSYYKKLSAQIPDVIKASEEIEQLGNLYGLPFDAYINTLKETVKPERLKEYIKSDFTDKLQQAFDTNTDTENTRVFDQAITFLYDNREYELINKVTDTFINTPHLKEIREVTWVNIALANLDIYELNSSQHIPAGYYFERVLQGCNNALMKFPDYGEAIMTKVFLYVITLMKTEEDAVKKEMSSKIREQFKLLEQSSVGCFEAMNAFNRNNDDKKYLFTYLQYLDNEFTEELAPIRIKAEEYFASVKSAKGN